MNTINVHCTLVVSLLWYTLALCVLQYAVYSSFHNSCTQYTLVLTVLKCTQCTSVLVSRPGQSQGHRHALTVGDGAKIYYVKTTDRQTD